MGSIADDHTGTRHRLSTNRFFQSVVLASFLAWPASAKDDAPPSPDHSWAPPALSDYEHELARTNIVAGKNSGAIEIDPDTVYTLPELIDLAERSNPDTRVAWEQARVAARTVGLSESAYYPYLAASAGAVFEHELGTIATVFPANAAEEDAALDVKWLLFDFGGRTATVAAARAQLMAANVGFNATHQHIVFAVTKSFYDFNTARELVAVAQSSLDAAQTVDDATQARFDHGLDTKPDVLQAEQETAEADYNLEAARGTLSDAQIALAESMGILPPAQFQVAGIPDQRFAENPEEPLDDLIQRALSQRPDLVAQLAKLHASQDSVRLARSAYYPKISLEGSGGWSKLDINAYDSPYVGNSKPVYGIGLSIDLPIFDGFLRRNKLRAAEAELHAAESQLAGSQDAAVREVWKAYTDLKTALRKQTSADKLRAAAQSAFDASMDSYRNGLETYVDVSNAQRNLTAARSTVVTTRSAIFTSTAALALSVGDLARPVSLATAPHQP